MSDENKRLYIKTVGLSYKTMNWLHNLITAMPVKKLLDQLDIVSGAVLFIVAVNVLGMFWWALIHGKAVDNALVTWSLGIVAAKTAHGVMTQNNDKTDPPAGA